MKQETKKKILMSLLVLLALVFAAGVGWLIYYMSQVKEYKDSEHKFSIVYPSKWEKNERYLGTAVAFVRPKQTALDVFSPNVNISVQDVPDEIATLKSFSETITKQMTTVFQKNITIVKDQDMDFGGRKGHILVVNAPQPQNLKSIFVWTIKGSKGYIFTFMSRIDQYKEVEPLVDRMIHSFKLQ